MKSKGACFGKKKCGKICECDYCHYNDYCLNVLNDIESNEVWLCESCRRLKSRYGGNLIEFINKNK